MEPTKEQAKILFDEARSVLDIDTEDEDTESIWGFKGFGNDGVILIGGDLTKGKRHEILERLPHFKCVLFLRGLSREVYREDPNLIQRVMMYGGSLPGWRWAAGESEWKEFPQECIDELEAMRRVGVVSSSPAQTKSNLRNIY